MKNIIINNDNKMKRLMILALIPIGIFIVSSCCSTNSKIIREKTIKKRIVNGIITEKIVKKTISTKFFSPINPEGKFFGYTSSYEYYLRSEKEFKLNLVDAPYMKFFPVNKSNLWICIAQKINSINSDLIDNTITVFDNSKEYHKFEVNECNRNKGAWGLKFVKNKLIFIKENKNLIYNPRSQQFENYLDSPQLNSNAREIK